MNIKKTLFILDLSYSNLEYKFKFKIVWGLILGSVCTFPAKIKKE